MKTPLKLYLFVLAFAVGLRSECGGAEIGDVPVDLLGRALVKNSPHSEYIKMVDEQPGWVKVANSGSFGAKINAIMVQSGGLAFKFTEQGGGFPLLRLPIPDPTELAKAKTMNQLVKLFLAHEKNDRSGQAQFFHNRNGTPEAGVFLSTPGTQYAHRLGAMYVQDGRLIGVSCYLWYYPTDKPEGLDSKIDMLSVDMWISTDFSKLP
jgi:hypothetical protein